MMEEHLFACANCGGVFETPRHECSTAPRLSAVPSLASSGWLDALTGSAPSLNREQRDILYHAEHRSAGGYYCGGGKDMDALAALGLMASAGRKSFVPDEYFRITAAGRAALRAQNNQAQVRR
jgi:hypothetical protein